jgi:hypothetical protein
MATQNAVVMENGFFLMSGSTRTGFRWTREYSEARLFTAAQAVRVAALFAGASVVLNYGLATQTQVN